MSLILNFLKGNFNYRGESPNATRNNDWWRCGRKLPQRHSHHLSQSTPHYNMQIRDMCSVYICRHHFNWHSNWRDDVVVSNPPLRWKWLFRSFQHWCHEFRGGSRIFCREGSTSGADPEIWLGGLTMCWPKGNRRAAAGGLGVLPRKNFKSRCSEMRFHANPDGTI
jgi:hypothetical protein